MGTRELSIRTQQLFSRYTRMAWAAKMTAAQIAGLAAVISPILFQGIVTVVQLLQPGHDPVRDTISSMVWGAFGWLQTAGFYLLGFSLIVWTVKLYFATNGKVYRTGITILAVIGAGFVLLGIFPSQTPGAVRTIQAIIHGRIVSAISLLFPLVCFTLALLLWRHRHFRGLSLYTGATGVVALGLIGVGIVTLITGNHGIFGMLERVFLLNGLTWVEVTGLQLLPVASLDCSQLS
ncbi:MAG: DUF998 domain-containing protein [Chloroflexi bacterium]|nr:DUF998 domain-containing protein [Chloroflexota bacterium]